MTNKADFDTTNSGVIFPNVKRRDDRSPTGKGEAHVCCPGCGLTSKFWISSWIKTSKAGAKFNSLAFTADQPKVNKIPVAGEDYDEDCPF